MKDSSNRVVISGVGLTTPLGNELEEVWKGLLEEKNGIVGLHDVFPELASEQQDIHVVGKVPDFQLSTFGVSRKIEKKVDRITRQLLYAGLSALKNAGLEYPEDTENYGIGAIIGTSGSLMEYHDGVSLSDRKPSWVLDTYPNLRLSYLSIVAALKGPGSTLVNACASGNQAIGEAFHMIRTGRAKVMLAGGADGKINLSYISGFSRLKMATGEMDPDKAMCPFDKRRNGFVIAEGASILVLESLQNALDRGAKPLAEVVGYGCGMDANSLTDADCAGKKTAILSALNDAGISSEEIDYINAHGTSTISNDKEETDAIKEVFGKRAYSIPINSTKSMMGHSFAACGAIEAAVCLKSLMEQQIHGTKNFQDGAECDLDYVADGKRLLNMNYCLNNSSGLGGFNSSLIFRKID